MTLNQLGIFTTSTFPRSNSTSNNQQYCAGFMHKDCVNELLHDTKPGVQI